MQTQPPVRKGRAFHLGAAIGPAREEHLSLKEAGIDYASSVTAIALA